MDLDGRIAIVTGAAQGIGKAIARDLAGRGAKLLIVDIQGDKLKAIAGEIEAQPNTVLGSETDVTHSEQVERMLIRIRIRNPARLSPSLLRRLPGGLKHLGLYLFSEEACFLKLGDVLLLLLGYSFSLLHRGEGVVFLELVTR